MAVKALEGGFALVLAVVVPLLSFRTARRLEILSVPRIQLYLSAAMSQWVLAALGAGVVWVAPLSLASVGFRMGVLQSSIYWAVLLAAISLAALALVVWFERRGWIKSEPEMVRALIPQTRREKIWAVLVIAPTAALCEEFLYRGFLQAELSLWFHSALWATVVSSVVFGMAHAYQGVSGMARAALLGALLTVPVIRLGTILPSMASHFLIDAVALVWLGPKLPGPQWPISET